MENLDDILIRLRRDECLSIEQMEDAMTLVIRETTPHTLTAEFLTLLSRRGETAEEITGAAKVLRRLARTITAPDGAVDCCGTGGDGLGTYNISTAAALVAAACGVPVAKHGNRAASSKSGAADVLEALGVNLDISRPAAEEALRQYRFAFLMAPRHHEAMKHVAPIRKALGMRTIFNLVGPLANPAGTRRQLVGVYDRRWLMPMAEALRNLDAEKAWVVYGADGLDEITVTGKTDVVMLSENQITQQTLHPDDFSLSLHKLETLTGGDAAINARALQSLLDGVPSAYRDIVIANAAAILVIHETASDLSEAAAMAAEAIDSGAAGHILERYRIFSRTVAA